MSDDENPAEISKGGSRIYRHGEATPWAPPMGEDHSEAISNHIEIHLGPIDSVFHELLSDTVHIDVYCVRPSEDFPYVRLITSGMSDLPMSTPEGLEVPKHIELLITLPEDWQFPEQGEALGLPGEDASEDERWYWPVHLIKTLGLLPHKHFTWLGWGHTIPNGSPPQPLADNTVLCGALLLAPSSVPDGFRELRLENGKTIAFFAVIPLYEDEMTYKLRHGTEALSELFAQKKVTDIVNLTRPNVAKKRFGWW